MYYLNRLFKENSMEQTNSQWCYDQRDKSLAEGRFKDADVYLNLAVLWKERELKEASSE